MSLNKLFGFILLAIGLLIIGWTLWQSYGIFTGKASVPLAFTTLISPQSQSSGQNVQSQINDTVRKQIDQIIPASSITKILNLAAWGLLAFVFISGGGALCSIGVKLTK